MSVRCHTLAWFIYWYAFNQYAILFKLIGTVTVAYLGWTRRNLFGIEDLHDAARLELVVDIGDELDPRLLARLRLRWVSSLRSVAHARISLPSG